MQQRDHAPERFTQRGQCLLTNGWDQDVEDEVLCWDVEDVLEELDPLGALPALDAFDAA